MAATPSQSSGREPLRAAQFGRSVIEALARVVRDDLPVYHRLESPTQTAADAKKQEQSNEVWGGANRNSWVTDRPSVDAYVGPLKAGTRGIEFETAVPPDPGQPPGRARWTGPRDGVRVEAGFAKLEVRITRNTQT